MKQTNMPLCTDNRSGQNIHMGMDKPHCLDLRLRYAHTAG